MSNDWLERSLSALEVQAQGWPRWKREAASVEPQFAIPAAEPSSVPTNSPEANSPSTSTER